MLGNPFLRQNSCEGGWMPRSSPGMTTERVIMKDAK
jgi:hypothetical protein